MPRTPDAADEIKQLYFAASKATIVADLERAITLLISLESDDARQRVAVYMDGLSQMRSEWGVKPPPASAPPSSSKSARAARPMRPARAGVKRRMP